MEACGRDKGVRSMVSDAGPSTMKCIGPEATLLSSRGVDETSCPGGRGSATGISVLLGASGSYLALKDKMGVRQ